MNKKVSYFIFYASKYLFGYSVPYKWEQTLEEVTVSITVPDNKKARDYEIKIAKDHLLVKKRGGEDIINVRFLGDTQLKIILKN